MMRKEVRMKTSGEKKTKRRKRILCALLALFAALCLAFFAYCAAYYRAQPQALDALQSSGRVTVTAEDTGWFFDGPGSKDLLVFYPGGKVEETAYAPLMRSLAEEGVDACLVKMPFRLAVFGTARADEALEEHGAYERVCVGGHSLGGAMAAAYAAEHPGQLDGVVLLAAYSAKPLPAELPVLLIRGSEDGVLDREKYERNKSLLGTAQEIVIPGGNHGGFGSYGHQKGDGEASLTAQEQQAQTVRAILDWLAKR